MDSSQGKKAKNLLRRLFLRAPKTAVIVAIIESFEGISPAASGGVRSLVAISETRGFSTILIFEKLSKYTYLCGKELYFLPMGSPAYWATNQPNWFILTVA